ncbi:MAG: aldo/keto reductase [Bacteroidia bacterium]|nr:aldo/keto reductase [Bacteroidia bacterium]NNF31775.1 aldo/keto reductase [Flavobacteriaceae bacterium]MBT8274565.1 aldo/keto reductase [Bacteroidia bacterium]NNJ81891.1 aldo/keto reductase [Flavobacteriaceae bacterium]NNK53972.1 aldo/keto reductase [Flavobacteriaceae bacterium]
MKLTYSSIIQGCMGWGVWGAKLSENEMTDRIHHCLENGITTFDHADIYGDYTTEASFGNAFSASNLAREDIQIISKCGIQYVGNTRDNEIKHYRYDADYIVWSAEKSISDLNSDYLDLLLLHRPSPLMQPDEVAKAVDKLISEGKIRSFGLSNFTPSQTALIASKSKVSANQIEFSLTAIEALWNGSLDDMMLNDITPMCWSPLGSVFKEDNEQTRRIHKVLDDLNQKYNATKDQLLLAWILKHPSGIHPVIGTATPERIANASKAASIDLSEIDWFRMLVSSQGHKVA